MPYRRYDLIVGRLCRTFLLALLQRLHDLAEDGGQVVLLDDGVHVAGDLPDLSQQGRPKEAGRALEFLAKYNPGEDQVR